MNLTLPLNWHLPVGSRTPLDPLLGRAVRIWTVTLRGTGRYIGSVKHAGAVVPVVSRLVTGSSVASIEKLEERTYVLTMPMQPVPATQVLESRGLQHSGHTWDQILELGFPAEVRRVELDPEAGVFMAYGTRSALKKVQAVVDRLTQDPAELSSCLDRIAANGHLIEG